MKLATASGNLWVSELWAVQPLMVEIVGSLHRRVGVVLPCFEIGKPCDDEPIERAHAPTGPPA